jgi:hypothetical protein
MINSKSGIDITLDKKLSMSMRHQIKEDIAEPKVYSPFITRPGESIFYLSLHI